MAVLRLQEKREYPNAKCSEKLIQQAYIRSKAHQRIVIIPNVSWGMFDHEMDLCEVSDSGYITEIEIKISRADLKADKDKAVFHTDKHNRIKYLYYAVPNMLASFALQEIPEYAGLISFRAVSECTWDVAEYVRCATEYKDHRKLTPEERIALYRLGCLRMSSKFLTED